MVLQAVVAAGVVRGYAKAERAGSCRGHRDRRLGPARGPAAGGGRPAGGGGPAPRPGRVWPRPPYSSWGAWRGPAPSLESWPILLPHMTAPLVIGDAAILCGPVGREWRQTAERPGRRRGRGDVLWIGPQAYALVRARWRAGAGARPRTGPAQHAEGRALPDPPREAGFASFPSGPWWGMKDGTPVLRRRVRARVGRAHAGPARRRVPVPVRRRVMDLAARYGRLHRAAAGRSAGLVSVYRPGFRHLPGGAGGGVRPPNFR